MTEHPARLAGAASRTAVMAKDKETWLTLFAEDAVIEDPVGPSLFDESGAGHQGHEAISAFWDKTIANTERIDFQVTDSFACGDECASIGVIRSVVGGQVVDAEGVFVYRVNEEGKLRSLRAFWEFDRAMKTMRPVSE